MLRPNRRPSHTAAADDDLNGSSSSLDLNYGNANVPAYSYGGHHQGSATTYPAVSSAASYGVGLGRNPAADSYSIYKDKPARRSGGALEVILAALKQPMAWAALLALALLGNTFSYRSQVNRLLGEMNAKSIHHAKESFAKLQTKKVDLERDHAKAKSAERQATQRYMDLDKSFKALQRDREDLKRKLKTAQESPPVSQQQESSSLSPTKELAYQELIQSLQASVQRESRRAVLEKFGAPPYRVQLTVKLPSNLNEPLSFTVELAPLEYMPHSVHLFLEQVAHGLWNGNSFFYVNGPHVIQCGPQATLREGEVMTSPEQERVKALAPFKELQLDGLTFPEYSSEYPHLPWTLGFTGRPGGPDWYINKRNNTIEHGPGGGGSTHELSGEYGDPCFAKVVDGFEVVKSMFAEATIHSGDASTQYYFEEPIQILKAEIVDWNQQLMTEASAIATNATIQHATGERLDVNATIQAATGAEAVGNLTEAATKIAAKLAEVGELHKKLEGLNHGPWNVKTDNANREKQDLQIDEGGPSVSSAENKDVQSVDASSLMADGAADTQASTASNNAQIDIPDSGLPRPGGDGTPQKDEALASDAVPSGPTDNGGGNIDPQYADNKLLGAEKVDMAFTNDAPTGVASINDKKKKKELMMAKS